METEGYGKGKERWKQRVMDNREMEVENAGRLMHGGILYTEKKITMGKTEKKLRKCWSCTYSNFKKFKNI